MLAVVVAFSWTPANAQDWIEYVNRDEMFAVNLPHDPAVEEIVYESEFHAQLPAKVFTASDGMTDHKITVVDYTDDPIAPPRNVYDLRGSIAYAAFNIRKRGGEITYDSWAQIDRIEGHQMQITNDDGSRTYVAIHLHGTRLYILEARARPGAPPPIQFQQSVSILDENGEVVRYDIDFRTRIDP
jgi:hypothetical protein